MGDEVVADFRAGTDQHVQHAGRRPSFLEGLGQDEGAGERGVGGGLKHHRVAQREGRGHRAGGEQHREVPRADHRDHTQRLAVDAVLLAGEVRGHDLPVHAGREGCRFADRGNGAAQLDVGLQLRGTRLGAEQGQDVLVVGLQVVGGLFHHGGAGGRRQGSPCGLGLGGGLVGGVHVSGGSLADFGKHRIVEGIGRGQRGGGGALYPLAVDEQRGGQLRKEGWAFGFLHGHGQSFGLEGEA